MANKSSLDVAAHNSSFESPSFSGLLSFQDQQKIQDQHKTMSNTVNNTKHDQEFQFQRPRFDYSIENNHKMGPPLALFLSPNPPKKKPPMARSPDSSGSNQADRYKIRENNSTKSSKRGCHDGANRNSSFGGRFLRSVMKPCRKNDANEPIPRAKIIPREKRA